jgi:proline iminopeptidase
MNPAPVSAADLAVFRQVYLQKLGVDMDRQRAIVASPAYQDGHPAAVYERYRLHFKPALKRSDDYERLMIAMKAGFTRQGRAGIVKARAIEDRLMRDSWEADGYDLMPKLPGLQIPTLVISGAYDFIPPEVAARIAGALPRARLVALPDCGHFAYLVGCMHDS